MSETTRLSTRGQVVLPKPLRTARRWRPGTEFIVEERDGGVLLTPKDRAGSRAWDNLIGCVSHSGPRKSVREMDRAVEAEARTRR